MCVIEKFEYWEEKCSNAVVIVRIFFRFVYIFETLWQKYFHKQKKLDLFICKKQKEIEWKNKSKKFHRSWTLQNICACTQKLTFKIYDIYKERAFITGNRAFVEIDIVDTGINTTGWMTV